MEIKGENYLIIYDSSAATITCQGSLRLYGAGGYNDITKLFDEIAGQKPEVITLDLKDLQFLNSSGINAISKFVIKVRDKKASRIVVRGTDRFPWQSKSLKNLQRLMPALTLKIE